jgi:ArsR family transcriptional regulator, arsenate/arsenite/antimonite-responsive transcriptional repressor / arsenate reductase (thioredoxin)
MEIDRSIETLSALAHPGRLAVFRLLARRAPDAVRAGEIAGALELKPNTLSNYVSVLSRAGLITAHRFGTSISYRINLTRAGEFIDFLVMDCCRGRPELCDPLAAHALHRLEKGFPQMTDRKFNVLFICTGNSARSIFAEAIINREGADKFQGFSAGTSPYSELNPNALEVLRQLGYDTSKLKAKNISEFQKPDAPKMDFVFTVCDRAANEECAPWPGQPISAHWGLPDPVKVEGTTAERALAFKDVFRAMRLRLTGFLALPIDKLDRVSLQKALDEIGEKQVRSDSQAS